MPTPMFVDVLLGFPVNRPLPRCFTVVIDLFALRQGGLAFDQIFLQINSGRNESESLLLNSAREFVQFLPMKQKTAVAQWLMVRIASCRIGTDVAVDEIRLALLNVYVAVFQINFP